MNIEAFASKVDLLGLLAFIYVTIYATMALKKERSKMNWTLLLIGIGGIIVDLFVVVNTYLK